MKDFLVFFFWFSELFISATNKSIFIILFYVYNDNNIQNTHEYKYLEPKPKKENSLSGIAISRPT